eukprot:gene7909-10736_t
MSYDYDYGYMNNDSLSNRFSIDSVLFQQIVLPNKYYSIQKYVRDFCHNHSLVTNNCLSFNKELMRSLYLKKLSRSYRIPDVQIIPTTYNPFVFIHTEKTGGSTLREYISRSAEERKLETIIPCHGGIHCVTFDINSNLTSKENTSVVAGHFNWGIWNKLPQCSNDHNSNNNESNNSSNKCLPSSLVMSRHPINRAISFYYERCYRDKNSIGFGRRINDLTVKELEDISMFTRKAEISKDNEHMIIDEGMENAVCRTMAAQKKTSGLIMGVDELVIPPPLDNKFTEIAINNTKHCVIGVLERWDETIEVINHWFPWIDFTKDRNKRLMWSYVTDPSIHREKENKNNIRPELRIVLENINYCDLALYDEMNRIFEMQLKVARDQAFFET